eukprot:1157919-Pelagomonas_calceolata.AAC.10
MCALISLINIAVVPQVVSEAIKQQNQCMPPGVEYKMNPMFILSDLTSRRQSRDHNRGKRLTKRAWP